MHNVIAPAPSATELLFRVNAFISKSILQEADDEEFNRLALAMFAFQFVAVPIYRKVCERRGAGPDTVRHWSEIPALPAAAFKEHAVSSLPENERERVFHSSGTTGHVPGRHFHNAASLSIYEASLLPWFERHFLGDKPDAGPRGGMFVFFTPTPTLAQNSSLVHMFQAVRHAFAGANSFFAGTILADGSWRMENNLIDTSLRGAMAENRPVALLGTAFSFVHWLDYLAAEKIRLRLPPGSRLMETGGYKGRSRTVAKADLRRLVTKHLGIPESHILTEYGMSELSSQAYDGVVGQASAATRVFQFPPWARARVIRPETGAEAAVGETGLLRIFDMANIHSVMALQTEDLAVNRGEGFEMAGRVESAELRGCSLLATN